MKTHRTCPACAAPQGFARLWLRTAAWARWDCPGCGARLGWNPRRRLAVALVQAPLIAVALLTAFRGDFARSVPLLLAWLLVWRFDSLAVQDAGPSD